MSNKIKVTKDDAVEEENVIGEDVTGVAAQGQSGDEAETTDMEANGAEGEGGSSLETSHGIAGKKILESPKIKKLRGRKARKNMPSKEEIATARYSDCRVVFLNSSGIEVREICFRVRNSE